MVTALLLAAALGQAEPAGDAPPPTDTQAPKALIGDNPTPQKAPDLFPRPVDGTNPNTPQAVRRNPPTLDEVNRQLERIKKLQGSDLSNAMDLYRKGGQAGIQNAAQPPSENPNEPPKAYGLMLSEPDQVKEEARAFFNDVISGDARSIVLHSGYPFYLEDRRLELPDELHDEWLKNLRSKRTDLLTLYDIEVLTPQEMEKKYGKPPARLKNLPWNQGHTFIAVGNLSGHACIAVFRESIIPHHFQIVGYTD